MILNGNIRALDVDFVNVPVTYNGEVVGKIIGMNKYGTCRIVVESDDIKRLIGTHKSFSLEVRAKDEEVL